MTGRPSVAVRPGHRRQAGGMTSHDVVARIRRLAGTRRVGHAGTLDPMATGVLVVGVEKATRLLGYLTLTEKDYDGHDPARPVDEHRRRRGRADAAAPGRRRSSREALDAGVARLTGEILQVPPSVSAIKVDGQRAYKLTRAGAAPELAARPVTVYEFSVAGVRAATATSSTSTRAIRCSSGTYIRALARDLGAALGIGGHLTALRRTAVGPYRLEQAHSLEDLSERMQLTPLPAAAAAAFPRLDLTADDARRLAHGVRIPVPPHGTASHELRPPLRPRAAGIAPAAASRPGIARGPRRCAGPSRPRRSPPLKPQ